MLALLGFPSIYIAEPLASALPLRSGSKWNGVCHLLLEVPMHSCRGSPKYFMSDYSEVELGAIEEEFPQSLCDFHREQS